MKVVILAPANSIHTQQWIDGLSSRGLELTLATQHPSHSWIPPRDVTLCVLPHRGFLGYFRNAVAVRRLVRASRPDLLHVHYASGYGTTAALTGFHPYLLSVWGSDIFEFPRQARWKAMLLRFNLRRATRIASTSEVMAREVLRVAPTVPMPAVTPFGVDTERFVPAPRKNFGVLTIGTVKTLAWRYGIDLLIRAFAMVLADADLAACPTLQLLIVGGGEQRVELEALAASLGVTASVTFAGEVAHGSVPLWLSHFDIYVAASREESFGVAVIEASACGLPVVVSDVGGLPEVVADGVTGFIVPAEDPTALAAAIGRLVCDGSLRRQMGDAGRGLVTARYDRQRCLDTMESLYIEVLASTL